MGRPARIVGLLTDFGPGSEHVGAMHAVLEARCPGVTRVDLAHDIPPGQVRWAAVQLARLAPLLPRAVHLAVVDPGVGTDQRRPLAVGLTCGGALVGPDNGLLGLAAARMGARWAVAIDPPRGAGHVSATFHGRDLFAPAAAHLAAGGDPAGLGPEVSVDGIRSPSMPAPAIGDGQLIAEVLGADRFGNVALIAGAADLASAGLEPGDAVTVDIEGTCREALVTRAFADAAQGTLIVHLDSHGHVALAVTDGDAEARLGAGPGRACRITRRRLTPASCGG